MEDTQINLDDDLRLAAQNGKIKAVEGLILSGANIHAFDEVQMTALHYAVQGRNRQLVHWLIKQGADVNSHNADYAGETPLSLAAENGDFGIAKLLLGLGANPYVKGWMWNDALDRAEKRKDSKGDMIRDLILREHPPTKERLKRDYKRERKTKS